jgi:NAD(P)-dependent dehydrogenase (short-subunit alcohol dehydrogenase family)
MNLSFENMVALVTGAGSGMGLATAKACELWGEQVARRTMLSISIFGTTTLSQPDPIPELGSRAALPGLSPDAEGPVFAEPWQAQAFALAVNLSEQGHFTWTVS